MPTNRRELLGLGTCAALALGAAPAAAAESPGAPAASNSSGSPWARRGTVARAGGVMGYALAGEGPPLVLLPKLGGWIDDWSPIAPRLAAERRLVAIDPPGHGSSRMATPPPRIQMLAESAALVRATLDELGIERCALIGNSLGGCIGATLAAHWPTLVSHLVLISTAIYGRDPIERILADEANANPRTYDEQGLPLVRSAERARATFGMSSTFLDEMNRSRAAAGLWIRASERGVRREGLADLLPRIAAPTLLLYGDSGSYLRHRATAERLIPRVRSVTIAGGGSFMHQEKPAETARTILEFLRT